MAAIHILALGIALFLAAPQRPQVLVFFPEPGARPRDYSALMAAYPGFRFVYVPSPASRKNWSEAGKLSAMDQLAFEKKAVADWVRAALAALKRQGINEAGAIGHGPGGLAAAAACQLSPAFRACLDIDGETLGSPFLLDAAFDQPFLWLKPLTDPVAPPTSAELKERGMTRGEYEEIMSRSGTAAMTRARRISTIVTLYAPDAGHRSILTERAGTRSFVLATAVIRDFFDEHLRGHESALFSGFGTGYPEIVFQQFFGRK